jgi:hypothetical protein
VSIAPAHRTALGSPVLSTQRQTYTPTIKPTICWPVRAADEPAHISAVATALVPTVGAAERTAVCTSYRATE